MSFFNHQTEMFDIKKRLGDSSSAGAKTPILFNSLDKMLNSDEIDFSAPGKFEYNQK